MTIKHSSLVGVTVLLVFLGGCHNGPPSKPNGVVELAKGIACLLDPSLCDALGPVGEPVAATAHLFRGTVTAFNRQSVQPHGWMEITFGTDQVAHLSFWTGQRQALSYVAVQQSLGVWTATFQESLGKTIGRLDMQFIDGQSGYYQLQILPRSVWSGTFVFQKM